MLYLTRGVKGKWFKILVVSTKKPEQREIDSYINICRKDNCIPKIDDIKDQIEVIKDAKNYNYDPEELE
jgi:hypothetical protein